MVKSTRRTLVVLLFVWSLPILCNAQQAPQSLDELAGELRPGSEVTVTDMDGHAIRGRIVRLSVDTLELRDGVSLGRREIRQIRHHTRGPLGNGALWGALIGAGVGAAVGAAGGDGGIVRERDAVLGLVALGAVVGTTTGVLIDFFRTENHVVYGVPGDQVRISPRPPGVRIALRF